jgi:hypothetical protein
MLSLLPLMLHTLEASPHLHILCCSVAVPTPNPQTVKPEYTFQSRPSSLNCPAWEATPVASYTASGRGHLTTQVTLTVAGLVWFDTWLSIAKYITYVIIIKCQQ